MKIRLCIVLFLFFHSVISLAQVNTDTLSGVIVVSKDTIPYRLVIKETNGDLKGYSLTYNDPYETKAKITGVLDRRSHTLTFKETEIVYIHGYHSGPSLCLVDASLQLVHGSTGNFLKGPITSTETDNTSCGDGRVIFGNQAEIETLFSLHEKFDTVITMKRRVKDTSTAKAPPAVVPEAPLVTDKVTKGEEKVYEWHSDTVVIDIWDGGNVDGDRITLRFNDKVYLSGYSLVKEKKQLRIPLSGSGTAVISVLAENEGSEPPNTASMLLTDGTQKYSVLAYNKKGQEAIIKIKKAK